MKLDNKITLVFFLKIISKKLYEDSSFNLDYVPSHYELVKCNEDDAIN